MLERAITRSGKERELKQIEGRAVDVTPTRRARRQRSTSDYGGGFATPTQAKMSVLELIAVVRTQCHRINPTIRPYVLAVDA
jgi:hypothetical protein